MDKYCIYQNYTIKEAIERIDANHDRVVIVLNNNERVIGVVSQGDVIRALCKGKSLYSSVEGIIQPDFLYLNHMEMEKAYAIFRRKKITLLPVIDEDYRLRDVITLDIIYKYLEEKCAN